MEEKKKTTKSTKNSQRTKIATEQLGDLARNIKEKSKLYRDYTAECLSKMVKMNYFVRVSTIFSIFFFIQMSTFISCEDTTSSVDNTDTTVIIWTKENSPYVMDTYTVERGTKLIIEPG